MTPNFHRKFQFLKLSIQNYDETLSKVYVFCLSLQYDTIIHSNITLVSYIVLDKYNMIFTKKNLYFVLVRLFFVNVFS